MLITAVAFAVALLVVGVVFGRMLMRRDAERKRVEHEGRKRRMTRRERILATLEPDPEIPTVIDLMHAEARDTGVNEFAGGDRLEVPVKLKVWHRDGGPHAECPRQGLRFEVADGVEPEHATVEDVRLGCSASHPSETPPSAAPTDEHETLPGEDAGAG